MGARELIVELTESGFSLQAEGGHLVIRPASKLTDPIRVALREAKPDLLPLLAARALDPSAVDWTESDAGHFLERRARLMRWGWVESEAQKFAVRLTECDRKQDDRVSCADCRHYRPNRCANHRSAGLVSHEVGRDFASIMQRCLGFNSINSPDLDAERNATRQAQE